MSNKKHGFCLWFTGYSGAGKTTIASAVELRINGCGRATTMLDGDVVRAHLSKGLGFSKEDRDANVKRIGVVAARVVKHGGIAICASISPYKESRRIVKDFFDKDCFVEIYVSTPLGVCESRDPKGLYSLVRQGKKLDFTGIDSDYQVPDNADLVLDTSCQDIVQSVQAVLDLISIKYGLVFN
jgi:sulfate adenylyltransferase